MALNTSQIIYRARLKARKEFTSLAEARKFWHGVGDRDRAIILELSRVIDTLDKVYEVTIADIARRIDGPRPQEQTTQGEQK